MQLQSESIKLDYKSRYYLRQNCFTNFNKQPCQNLSPAKAQPTIETATHPDKIMHEDCPEIPDFEPICRVRVRIKQQLENFFFVEKRGRWTNS